MDFDIYNSIVFMRTDEAAEASFFSSSTATAPQFTAQLTTLNISTLPKLSLLRSFIRSGYSSSMFKATDESEDECLPAWKLYSSLVRI